MNSKKFSFYYFLTVLLVTSVLIGAFFLLSDIEPKGASWFGPNIIPFFILVNPIYVGWFLVSLLSFIISHFINTEKTMRLLNWTLFLSPLLLSALWEFMHLFKSGLL